MSNFKRRQSSDRIKWTIVFTLIALLLISMIFSFMKIEDSNSKKELGQNFFTYSIGLIDEEGKELQGTTSIRTKKFHSVDGLECDIVEKATITYKVFFYDEDKNFISVTSSLATDSDNSIVPETAKFFKLEISPTNDAEVSFSEINDYANMLNVSINK